MSFSEATTVARRDGSRGVVLRRPDGTAIRSVFIARGRVWIDRGNPECLEPYSPSLDEAVSLEWEPSDDV